MSVDRRGSALFWAGAMLALVYVGGISAVYFAPAQNSALPRRSTPMRAVCQPGEPR